LSAQVVVVTNNRSIDASLNLVASVDGASVAVIAVLWSVETSNLYIASINGASIIISASNSIVVARSSCMVARISGTCIAVVTVDRLGVNSSQNIAKIDVAFVNICCIECNDVLWNIFASSLDIARIISARICIITNNSIVSDCSSGWVAIVLGASVAIVNILEGVDASTAWAARIVSAWI